MVTRLEGLSVEAPLNTLRLFETDRRYSVPSAVRLPSSRLLRFSRFSPLGHMYVLGRREAGCVGGVEARKGA